jgi:hypothetical protein
VLLALLMMGCDRCDEEALTSSLAAAPGVAEGADPDAAAALLSESCRLPEPLAAWLTTPDAPPVEAGELWSLACPGGPALADLSVQPRRQRLLAATEACGLDEGTAWLDGYPLLAHATAAWMTEREVSDELTSSARTALAGQPQLRFPSPAPPALPTLNDGEPLSEAPEASHLVTVIDSKVYIGDQVIVELSEGGLLPPSAPLEVGMFPAHRHPALIEHAGDHDWLLAVDTTLPSETLVRIAVSLAAAGSELGMLGTTAEGLVVRSLRVPDSDALSPRAAETAGELTELALGEVPCGPPLEGMRCVQGASVGGAVLSTFYIDEAIVSAEDYAACAATRSCTRRRGGQQWQDAFRYCTWAGKRLPTAWELSAAGGDVASWSDTWAPAGEAEGRDPLGPCDGAPSCRGHRQRVAVAGTDLQESTVSAGLAVRCVTDQPHLTRFPAAIIATVPPDPEPLTDAQRAIFRDITEDPIWEKPECQGEWGTVTLSCRDPLSYVKSNERRAFIWAAPIRNRGGAYVGVGSDQNYSYAALSRAELVWLMDYDPDVVALHQINRAFTIPSETVKDFLARYSPRGARDSVVLLKEEYAEHPDLDHILYVYGLYRKQLYDYYYSRSLSSGREVETEWLRNPELYAYIRLLWQTDRIWPVKGDLTKHALASIGAAATKLGVPVRTFYTSNAPDVWSGRLIENYKDGVLALPMDGRSIVLQTFLHPTGFGGPTHHHWHYNVQAGLEHQALMRRSGFTNVRELIYRRIASDDLDLTTSGLRSD